MSAILDHASNDLSIKRKTFIRGVIASQYKDLCALTQPITEQLFGDDLPKLISGLNLTNKIGIRQGFNNKDRNHKQHNRFQRTTTTYRRNHSSFLGRGRGSLPYRQNNYHKKSRKSQYRLKPQVYKNRYVTTLIWN